MIVLGLIIVHCSLCSVSLSSLLYHPPFALCGGTLGIIGSVLLVLCRWEWERTEWARMRDAGSGSVLSVM